MFTDLLYKIKLYKYWISNNKKLKNIDIKAYYTVEVKEDNEIISLKKEIYKDLEIVKLGEDVNKNKFLKEALISMQELYDEDRKTVETLTKQLKNSQDEVEFLKRKYKLMWNKAVENFKGDKE